LGEAKASRKDEVPSARFIAVLSSFVAFAGAVAGVCRPQFRKLFPNQHNLLALLVEIIHIYGEVHKNYSNSHKDFPKSGEALGQTRASAAHNSEIVYESRYSHDIQESWGFLSIKEQRGV
jgi:hypothetical protein